MTIHASNSFNVEASLNAWITTELNAIDLPAWWVGTRPTIVYDLPESELPTPCISLHHLPISQVVRGHKQVTATENGAWGSALLDISTWASRASPQWMAHIRFMTVMVETVTGGTIAVPTQYWADTEDGVQNTPHKVNIGNLEIQDVSADLNPDVMRRRMTVRYTWNAMTNRL